MTQKKDLYDDIEVKDVELVEEENIDAPDAPESKKVEGDDVDPSIMAVLRRKEAEQKEKDAERNKWIKRGLMVAAGIIAIIALILSLRSCGSGESGDGKPNKPDDPKHVHEYVEIVVPPTETEDGYTLYKCEECGDSYQDNAVDALGKEEEDKDKTPETDSSTDEKPSTDNKPTTPSNDNDKKPTTSTKPDNKPTDSKPTTTTPTNPTKPSDDKPSKPSEDTSSTTKPTEPEDTKPTTPSQPTKPSEPTKPPVETKCPHETTQHSGCRWNVSGCSCSHKHVVNKVGSYTHIYCEDEVVSHRDGKTIWYPWQYYTENTSNAADTSSKVTSSKPVTSTAPETKPVESKPTETKPVESTSSTQTTTPPTTSSNLEVKPEEPVGCTVTHPNNTCRYTVCDCEHEHIEQKVGSRTFIYCEDVTTAHRDGNTYWYSMASYVS